MNFPFILSPISQFLIFKFLFLSLKKLNNKRICEFVLFIMRVDLLSLIFYFILFFCENVRVN